MKRPRGGANGKPASAEADCVLVVESAWAGTAGMSRTAQAVAANAWDKTVESNCRRETLMSSIAILLLGDRRRMIFRSMGKVKYGGRDVKVNVADHKIGQVWVITSWPFWRIIRKAAAATGDRINEFK